MEASEFSTACSSAELLNPAHLRETLRALRCRSSWIGSFASHFESAMDERGKELERKERELEIARDAAEEKSRELEVREEAVKLVESGGGEIESVERKLRELEEKEEEFEALGSYVEERGIRVREKELAVEAKEKEIERIAGDLRVREGELEKRLGELKGKEGRIEEMGLEIREVKRRLGELEIEVKVMVEVVRGFGDDQVKLLKAAGEMMGFAENRVGDGNGELDFVLGEQGEKQFGAPVRRLVEERLKKKKKRHAADSDDTIQESLVEERVKKRHVDLVDGLVEENGEGRKGKEMECIDVLKSASLKGGTRIDRTEVMRGERSVLIEGQKKLAFDSVAAKLIKENSEGNGDRAKECDAASRPVRVGWSEKEEEPGSIRKCSAKLHSTEKQSGVVKCNGVGSMASTGSSMFKAGVKEMGSLENRIQDGNLERNFQREQLDMVVGENPGVEEDELGCEEGKLISSRLNESNKLVSARNGEHELKEKHLHRKQFCAAIRRSSEEQDEPQKKRHAAESVDRTEKGLIEEPVNKKRHVDSVKENSEVPADKEMEHDAAIKCTSSRITRMELLLLAQNSGKEQLKNRSVDSVTESVKENNEGNEDKGTESNAAVINSTSSRINRRELLLRVMNFIAEREKNCTIDSVTVLVKENNEGHQDKGTECNAAVIKPISTGSSAKEKEPVSLNRSSTKLDLKEKPSGTIKGNNNGEGSTAPSSKYQSRKRKEWKRFLRYYSTKHNPPKSVLRCTGAEVVEYLKHYQLEKNGFRCQEESRNPCHSGRLESLVGMLRAAYEVCGGLPRVEPV